jgi:hypothetical protein
MINKNFLKLKRLVVYYITEVIKKKIDNKTFNKITLHLYRSDFIVVLFINFFLIIVEILCWVTGMQPSNQISKKKYTKAIKISNLCFFFKNKVFELISSIYLINQKNEVCNFQKTTKKNIVKNGEIFDFIVVGSGPSGSITAYVLAKNKFKVLLVEEGLWTKNFQKKHPAEEFYYKWRNAGISSTLLPFQISYASGKCFGGGSEINSGLYHSPPNFFINNIRKKYKIENFSEKIISKSENWVKKELNLKKDRKKIKGCNSIFIEGAKKNNFKYEKILRLVSYLKNGFVQKKSMSNTLLKKFINYKNSRYLVGRKVVSLCKNNEYWDVIVKQRIFQFNYQAKNLILCCGALETSKLLIANKIIPKKKNSFKFYFHPMIKLIVKFKKKIISSRDPEDIHPFQITQFLPNYLFGKASSGKNLMQLSAYGDSYLTKDIEINYKKMSSYHITYSFGEGKIFKIPFSKKFIYFYKIPSLNLKVIKESLINFCRIFLNSKTSLIYITGKKAKIVNLKNYIQQIKQIKSINEFKFSSVHIMGGIPFGENKKECLANSYGKIYGYDNLYVNDGSLINDKLLKNPQGTIMTLAKRNIDLIINNMK